MGINYYDLFIICMVLYGPGLHCFASWETMLCILSTAEIMVQESQQHVFGVSSLTIGPAHSYLFQC